MIIDWINSIYTNPVIIVAPKVLLKSNTFVFSPIRYMYTAAYTLYSLCQLRTNLQCAYPVLIEGMYTFSINSAKTMKYISDV